METGALLFLGGLTTGFWTVRVLFMARQSKQRVNTKVTFLKGLIRENPELGIKRANFRVKEVFGFGLDEHLTGKIIAEVRQSLDLPTRTPGQRRKGWVPSKLKCRP
jgi:hypothetical protein